MSRNVVSALLLSLCFVALPSCVHTMNVPNSDDYFATPTHGPRQKIAVLPFEGKKAAEPFFSYAVEALRAHPSVDRIRSNWSWGLKDPGFQPDVVIALHPQVTYEGSAWNMPITFPGFLLFAHAWNGYVYYANIETGITIYDPRSKQVIEEDSLNTRYSMRHCDFERGFWASTGWWTPGYGATSLLSSFFMTRYDTDASKPFQEEIRTPYGEYIAESIVRPVIARVRGKMADAVAIGKAGI